MTPTTAIQAIVINHIASAGREVGTPPGDMKFNGAIRELFRGLPRTQNPIAVPMLLYACMYACMYVCNVM